MHAGPQGPQAGAPAAEDLAAANMRYFGNSAFKPMQREVIEAALQVCEPNKAHLHGSCMAAA